MSSTSSQAGTMPPPQAISPMGASSSQNLAPSSPAVSQHYSPSGGSPQSVGYPVTGFQVIIYISFWISKY